MSKIWAIADLHLSFGVPDKKMDVFGPQWVDHAHKIEENWRRQIAPEDLILIPGDISWALHLEDALIDLNWIDRLPGTKVLLRGNHDYWWQSISKIRAVLPRSCHLIQNNSFKWQSVSIGGSRLWDTSEYHFKEYIDFQENSRVKHLTDQDSSEEIEKIFQRELGRLETSLRALDPQAKTRIIMTHYPPISGTLENSRASRLLEKYKVDICVFGHLHNVKKEKPLFGSHHGIRYYLAAADYLGFNPIQITL